MFDILTTSALDISNGLLKEAWGGVLPQGGNDFPSACVISKCEQKDSQISIEIGIHPKANGYSAVPMLADRTRSVVIGPSDSDTPFMYAAGEITPPGIFGKALKSYGQVIALLRKYGVSETNYDNWFRVQWGVAPDVDLTGIIPTLRSENDALWGGMGRKLAPGALLHAAGSKQTRVTFHGYDRSNAGKHKLVDFPRLRAIASIAGSLIMLEDRYAAGKLKRLDFRIVGKEIPTSPANISSNLADIIPMETWAYRNIARGALEHVQGFRRTALILSRNALGTGGALELDDSIHVPAEALLEFISQNKVPSIPYTTFLNMSEPIFDIDDTIPTPKIDMQPKDKEDEDRVMTTYIAFASVIRPFVNQNFKNLPEAHKLRSLLSTLTAGSITESEEAEKVLRKVIAEVVPPDWLKRLYRLYCLVFKDKKKSRELMVKVMKDMNTPNGIFQNTDWLIAGPRILASKACYSWIVEEIARSVTRTVRERGTEQALVGSLRRILSSSSNGDLGLAEIVRQRKIWWANEYVRRSKSRDDKRVLYQQKSRLFRHAQLSIDSDGKVTLKDSQPALANVLENSARNFLRKRRNFADPEAMPISPGGMHPRAYAARLDYQYNPHISWVVIWDDFLRSIQMLIHDVEEIMVFIANDMPRDFGRVYGDLEDHEEHGGEDTNEEDPREEKGKQVDMDPEPRHNPTVDDFADFFDDDDLAGEVNDDQGDMVELSHELKEDVMDLREDVLIEQLSQYGMQVPVALYNEIMEETRLKVLEKQKAGVPGRVLDPVLPDYDVTDRYK